MGEKTTVGGLEMTAMDHSGALDTAPGILKPCPFCGHEAAFTDGKYRGHDAYVVAVQCSNTSCGVATPSHYKTRESAAAAWNRRARYGSVCSRSISHSSQ
jgi:Lar family restriction alleviation protein